MLVLQNTLGYRTVHIRTDELNKVWELADHELTEYGGYISFVSLT